MAYYAIRFPWYGCYGAEHNGGQLKIIWVNQ